jgi:predicted NUDIX family NTP pyrophosphohydrolase
VSAGLLLYKVVDGMLYVLIGHMGGPFWARKDAGAWSIPKGEYLPGEDPLAAALREFEEELGSPPPAGKMIDLGDIKQSSGKVVVVFALGADFDVRHARSNTFTIEWPKGSGKFQTFPEIDKVEWTPVETARTRLSKGQVAFLDRLHTHLEDSP